MSDTLEGSLPESKTGDEKQPNLSVNPLYNQVSIWRLPVIKSQINNVYPYGYGNNYPDLMEQVSERSSKLVSCMKKQAEFVRGLGFEGARPIDAIEGKSPVINKENETLYDLLEFCSDEKSFINIAIHVNFNQLGEAVEFNLVEYSLCRIKKKESKDKWDMFVISNEWNDEHATGLNGFTGSIKSDYDEWMQKSKEQILNNSLEVYAYNPDPKIVREQIEECGGIDKYSGQLFYKKRGKKIYQKAIFDCVSEDGQIQYEAKITSLSNYQQGFAGVGVYQIAAGQDSNNEIKELKSRLQANMQGSANRGRSFIVPYMPGTIGAIPAPYVPISQDNIDKISVNQIADAKGNIQELFAIPNAVLGKDTEGNFATQNMKDAYDAYNSTTAQYRQELERELTELISNSIFANQVKLPIKIDPLVYVSTTVETEPKTEKNETIN